MSSYLVIICLLTLSLHDMKGASNAGNNPRQSTDRTEKGCLRNVTMNWWEFPPYIYKDGVEIKGSFKDIVEKTIRGCCGNDMKFFYLNPKSSAEIVQKQMGANMADIGLPLHASMTTHSLENIPFFHIIESPGLIYLQGISEDNTLGSAVMKTAFDAWPVLVLTLIMAAISGIVMWSLDSYWNPDEFPATFVKGAWEGFWWAFVSMTTVGYGDKAPRSVFARIFSLIWVLIGLVIISIFTATVTTSLTALSLSNDLNLYGKNLVVLKMAEEYRYGVRMNNNIKVVDRIEEFADLIKNRKDKEGSPIHGGLIDAYRAGHERERLTMKHGIKFGTVVDHQFAYGFVVSKRFMSGTLVNCLRRRISLMETTITRLVQDTMIPLAEPKTSAAEETSSNLFDYKSTMYRNTVFGCLAIIGSLIVGGFLWEYVYWRPRNPDKIKDSKIGEAIVEAINPHVMTYEEMILAQCREFEETMLEEVRSFNRVFQQQLDEIKFADGRTADEMTTSTSRIFDDIDLNDLATKYNDDSGSSISSMRKSERGLLPGMLPDKNMDTT